MSYRCARVDENQSEIVEAARRLGASVAITSSIGNGFPDIVIGYRGRNVLVEIKNGKKPPSKRKLTEEEHKFHSTWLGEVVIISSIDELIGFLGGVNVKI